MKLPPLPTCNYGRDTFAGIALVTVLIIEEEKDLVVEPSAKRNGSADAATSDGIPIDRVWNRVFIVEESVRIQILVAEIRVHAAVKFFGTGSGHQIDHSSRASAVFGLVARGLHVDFD